MNVEYEPVGRRRRHGVLRTPRYHWRRTRQRSIRGFTQIAFQGSALNNSMCSTASTLADGQPSRHDVRTSCEGSFSAP